MKSTLKDNFKDNLDYLDTKKGREVLEAITTKIATQWCLRLRIDDDEEDTTEIHHTRLSFSIFYKCNPVMSNSFPKVGYSY